jgi:transcription elongation factor SPT5
MHDWVLDFRNLIVEVGPTSDTRSKLPRRFENGRYDGKRFGYDEPKGSTPHCVLLDDPSVSMAIPAEYLKPVRPDASQQDVIVVSPLAPGMHGSQLRTDFLDNDVWAMVAPPGQIAPDVVPQEYLCRIWNV